MTHGKDLELYSLASFLIVPPFHQLSVVSLGVIWLIYNSKDIVILTYIVRTNNICLSTKLLIM